MDGPGLGWIGEQFSNRSGDEGLWVSRGDCQTYFPVTAALSENQTDVSQKRDLGRDATGVGREGKV